MCVLEMGVSMAGGALFVLEDHTASLCVPFLRESVIKFLKEIVSLTQNKAASRCVASHARSNLVCTRNRSPRVMKRL